MGLVLSWLHSLPIITSFLLVVFVFVLPTLLGGWHLQPHVVRALRNARDGNAIAGIALSTIALFYAVLLGLLSLAVFQNYTTAGDTVEREAASVMTLGRSFHMYPSPLKGQLGELLVRYVDEEAGPGWAMQRIGRSSAEGDALVDRIGHLLQGFNPSTNGEKAVHLDTLRMFSEFVDRRQQRIDASQNSIPGVLWFVVLVGAVINTTVLWLFDYDQRTHLVVGGALSLFIGIMVFMLAALDQPFNGYSGLGPGKLVNAREQLLRSTTD